MKIIDLEDTLRWLDSHHIQYNSHHNANEGFVFAPENSLSLVLKVPVAAGQVLLFAQEMARWLPGSEVLLWITYWDTDPSDEYDYFNAWRQAQGESRRLIDAPGYLFDLTQANDRWLLSQVMAVLMAFTCIGFVVQPSGPDIIWLADDIVEISTHDAITLVQFAARFEPLGIEIASPPPAHSAG